MDVHPVARSAARGERTTTMAEMRRCIGSERFGIEPHDAPVAEFPKQPSQKDGLGRMCKTHWNVYTAGLARDAKARKAAASVTSVAVTEEAETAEPSVADPAVTVEPATLEPAAKRPRRAKAGSATTEGQEAAG
jgi:hypothetical protein